jgi:hypothetical protein
MSFNAPTYSKQLRADLVGVDLCVVDGLAVHGDAPILAACRKLVELGYDPAAELACFRNGRLAITVRNIGAGAALEIGTGGIGFKCRCERRTASPSAFSGLAAPSDQAVRQ